MRKSAVLLLVLALALVAGCGGESASPTPTPPPTTAPATATAAPSATAAPTGPAVCEVEPLDFPTASGIPPVTEEDYVHGPADAPITVIEYADFQ